MEELVTLAALVVLLLGIHIAFAVYLYRSLSAERDNEESTGLESVGEPKATAANSTPTEGSEADDRSTLTCPICGVPNDPSFQFCRRCVSDLSDHSTSQGGAVRRSGS